MFPENVVTPTPPYLGKSWQQMCQPHCLPGLPCWVMGRCQDVAAQPSTQHSGGLQQLANSGNNAFLIQYIFSCGEILTLLGRHKYIASNKCQ